MAAKPSASPGPPIGVPGFVESLDDVAPFAPGRWGSDRGTAIIGTGTSPDPEGAPHARPRPTAMVVEPQRPVRAPARHPDLGADGGPRCHDLGGRHRLLRAVRHRPVAGPLPGRDGPAVARPLRHRRADLRPGPPDGRPARGDPEVA